MINDLKWKMTDDNKEKINKYSWWIAQNIAYGFEISCYEWLMRTNRSFWVKWISDLSDS